MAGPRWSRPPPPPQVRQQHEIARRPSTLRFALPGTTTERIKSCGKPTSRCRDDLDQRHGPYIQWTRTVDGKTVTRRLTHDQLERYRPWFDNTRLLRQLTEQLHTVSIDAIVTTEGRVGGS